MEQSMVDVIVMKRGRGRPKKTDPVVNKLDPTKPLPNNAEEIFCQTVASGKTYKEAAEAYYLASDIKITHELNKKIRDFGSNFGKYPRISFRIAHLRKTNQKRTLKDYSLNGICDAWNALMARYEEQNDNGNVVKCLKEIGMLQGHYVTKTQNITDPLAGFSVTQLQQLMMIAEAISTRALPNPNVTAQVTAQVTIDAPAVAQVTEIEADQ